MLANLVLGQEVPSTTLGTILFVLVAFTLLVFLIKKFAWGPLVAMMEKREEKIAHDIDAAESSRIIAERLEAEREKALQNSRNEAVNIVNTAKASGEQSRQGIIEDAKADAEALKEKARLNIQREKEQTESELRKRAAELSLQLTSKLLSEELDESKHHHLIDNFINEVGQNHETR